MSGKHALNPIVNYLLNLTAFPCSPMRIKAIFSDLADLVFPDPCAGCNRPLATGEEYLCSNCVVSLPVFSPQENLLNRFAGRLRLQEARAYLKFYHGGIAQRLLHHIKYKNHTGLAVYLGKMLAMRLQATHALAGIEVVVPVPLHKSKLRLRGYNQSTYLAEGIAAVLAAELNPATVKRQKKSSSQTKKSRAERWQNVHGIFAVAGNGLKDKQVLLVDDVITTGATLEACGETLLAAGVASLSVAALAAAM